MPRYCFVSLAVLLVASVLFAAESPSASGWQLPAADARQWTERVRKLAPNGWTVSNHGNDIIVQRDAPVRWRRVEVNQEPGKEPPPRLHEGGYRLTLRFEPKMSIEDYEHLAAANAKTLKLREDLEESVADIPHKFDTYLPRNDDERRRLAAYREALAHLMFIPLPDLYTQDYSIQLLASYDGWAMLHDQEVAEECDGVRESILRYFGMYDPKAAADPHNLIHPEATANERGSTAKSSAGLPGEDVQLRDAVANSDIVALGKITSLGSIALEGPGQGAFGEVRIELQTTLKGSPDANTLSALLIVRTFQKPETIPEVGKEYLLFLKKDGKAHVRVIRISEADAATLAEIRRMIPATQPLRYGDQELPDPVLLSAEQAELLERAFPQQMPGLRDALGKRQDDVAVAAILAMIRAAREHVPDDSLSATTRPAAWQEVDEAAWTLAYRFARVARDKQVKASIVEYWTRCLAENRDLQPMMRGFPGMNDASYLTPELKRLFTETHDAVLIRALAYVIAEHGNAEDVGLLTRKLKTETDRHIQDDLEVNLSYMRWYQAGRPYPGPQVGRFPPFMDDRRSGDK